jgi:hypothetical protein
MAARMSNIIHLSEKPQRGQSIRDIDLDQREAHSSRASPSTSLLTKINTEITLVSLGVLEQQLTASQPGITIPPHHGSDDLLSFKKTRWP